MWHLIWRNLSNLTEFPQCDIWVGETFQTSHLIQWIRDKQFLGNKWMAMEFSEILSLLALQRTQSENRNLFRKQTLVRWSTRCHREETATLRFALSTYTWRHRAPYSGWRTSVLTWHQQSMLSQRRAVGYLHARQWGNTGFHFLQQSWVERLWSQLKLCSSLQL